MWIRLPHLSLFVLGVLAFAFLVGGVAAESAGPEQRELETRIRQIVATPRAQNAKSCAVAYLGRRPCGGARDYVIYSTEITDEQELQSLIRRYNALDSQRLEGMNSICEALVAGPLELSDGVCIEKPTAKNPNR